MNADQALSTDQAGAGKVWSIAVDESLQAALDRPDMPPLLRQALTGVLSWQARNETLVRRTLTSPRLAPQWAAALLALGATVTVEGETGPSEVPLEALLERRPAGEISTLRVPLGGPERSWGESRVARTPADEPIVAAVAVVETSQGVVRQIRIALTGVWSEPVRLAQAPAQFVGDRLDLTIIQAVAEAVEREVAPQGDFLGSQEYRRAMAGVTTRRALEACVR